MSLETTAWNAEYQFRKLFHVTHDQFLDTPVSEINWLMRIHRVYTDAENKKNSG